MKIESCIKESFSVIGKEGSTEDGAGFVQNLWADAKVSFEFRQGGTHFIKDGKQYKLQTKDLCSQARKAGIDFKAEVIQANESIV